MNKKNKMTAYQIVHFVKLYTYKYMKILKCENLILH